MVHHIDSIRRFVDRLVRRERALIAVEVAARLLLVLGVSTVAAIFAAGFRADRGLAAAGVTLLVGLGAWVAVVVPMVTRWRPAGDRLRQARLVEALRPELRGRLLTSVERLDGARRGESEPLLARIVGRAVDAVQDVPLGAVHHGLRALGLGVAAFVVLMLPLPLSLVAGGPVGVVTWWLADSDSANAAAALQLLSDAEEAKVGDLVLRYTYPAYTGLEARVVANSTGDISGPPGTTVAIQARTADPLEAAGLVAYDQRFEAQLLDERTIEARLTIEPGEGSYHLVTWRNGEERPSRELSVLSEDDLAPEVMLDSDGDVLELAVDERFGLAWRARDDFGISRVGIQLDGKMAGGPVYRAEARRAEVADELTRTPGELGLAPGARVKLEIAAWDNDTVSGPKVGVSRPIELVVLGARGKDARTEVAIHELVGAMILVLADHLEEPFPPGVLHQELADWAQVVAARYEPLQEVVDRELSRLPAGSMEREVLAEVLSRGSELVRFTAITFELGSQQAVSADDYGELRGYRDGAILALEDGILALDRSLRMRALRQAVDVTERMASIGQELNELLAEENPDSLELLAKLEQLEAMLQQLAEATAKLDEGGLKEFLNARENETRSLMEEVREAIAQGNMEEAQELMQRLARQLQQLQEGVQDTLERQKGEGDQSMQEAEQLADEMERLEQAQRDLQEEVSQVEREASDEVAERQAGLWRQVQAEAFAFHEGLGRYEKGLEDYERSFSELQRVDHALLQASQLKAAAQLQDYRGARAALNAAEYGMLSLRRGLQAAQVMSESLKGPGGREIATLDAHLAKIRELLDQLDQAASTPEAAERSQELQQRQQELEEQLESLSQKAEELSKDFPVRPGDMNERLDEAGERMEQASDDLGDGKPMPATGSQGAAADRLREAREELEQAMEQAAQQQQQLEPGGGGGQGEGEQQSRPEGEGGRQNDDFPEVEIPGAEAFRTPEEYRRALLEGMEGDVPEEYRALKKRYFEELVRQ